MKHTQKIYLIKNAGILDDAKSWVGKNLGISNPQGINAALGGAAAFVPGAIAGLATKDWRLPLITALLGGTAGYLSDGGPLSSGPGVIGRNAGKLTGAGLGATALGTAYAIPGSRDWLTGHAKQFQKQDKLNYNKKWDDKVETKLQELLQNDPAHALGEKTLGADQNILKQLEFLQRESPGDKVLAAELEFQRNLFNQKKQQHNKIRGDHLPSAMEATKYKYKKGIGGHANWLMPVLAGLGIPAVTGGIGSLED